MNRNLRRRQPKNEPAAADVDLRESEHVAQKSGIRLGVLTVDNRACAGDYFAELKLPGISSSEFKEAMFQSVS